MKRCKVTAGAALAASMLLAGGLCVPAGGAAAQEGAGERRATAPRPEAPPGDVESIDAIVGALYDVISGAAGVERDWDRFRSLFLPGAVLLPNFPEMGQGPGPHSVEEFIEGSREYAAQNGFFERETHRVTNRYGPVANVFSTYESRHAADDPEPFVRGINSIQLVHDGERWWVAHIAWTDVNEAGPIPERYR